MEVKKGTIKRKISTIRITDYQVRDIITDALINNKYDLVSEPILDNSMNVKGEYITIYRTEHR